MKLVFLWHRQGGNPNWPKGKCKKSGKLGHVAAK